MTHADLVRIGAAWLRKPWRNASPEGHGRCSVVLTELTAHTPTGETPDVIGWSYGRSILIECKATIADFRADGDKRFRLYSGLGMGEQRWYLVPVGLLCVGELPAGWGLLEAHGCGVVEVRHLCTTFVDRSRDGEIAMLLSALRRQSR